MFSYGTPSSACESKAFVIAVVSDKCGDFSAALAMGGAGIIIVQYGQNANGCVDCVNMVKNDFVYYRHDKDQIKTTNGKKLSLPTEARERLYALSKWEMGMVKMTSTAHTTA